MSPTAPPFSDYHPPKNPTKKVATARQILLTNAFVLGTNYDGFLIVPLTASSQKMTQGTNKLFGAWHTPTKLARQIAGADNIVVSNWFTLGVKPSPVTLLLSGDAAKQLVQAVSSARHYKMTADPGWVPDWELQFNRGTEHLASVHFTGWGFYYDNESFTDLTGVLANIGAAVRNGASEK